MLLGLSIYVVIMLIFSNFGDMVGEKVEDVGGHFIERSKSITAIVIKLVVPPNALHQKITWRRRPRTVAVSMLFL